jgi:hypothetical protein
MNATQTTPTTKLYVGEKFRVYVIRRGIEFWTGRGWSIAPYDAKCFAQFGMAARVMERERRGSEDEIRVVKCTLAVDE